MTVDLFTVIDLFDRALASAQQILSKGVEHAEGRGVSEAEMLEWRLIGDMQPLPFQFQVMINFARQWPARVAGIEVPADFSAPSEVTGLQAALAEARTSLATLKPEQFAARDDVPLTYTLGTEMTLTLPSGQWLSVFALMNIEFHLSIAYAILRSNGVPLGKADLFARGV